MRGVRRVIPAVRHVEVPRLRHGPLPDLPGKTPLPETRTREKGSTCIPAGSWQQNRGTEFGHAGKGRRRRGKRRGKGDAEEEQMIADGTGPVANVYVVTVTYYKGDMKAVEETGTVITLDF